MRRLRQLGTIMREEGLGPLLARVWEWLRTRVVDSGTTYWYVMVRGPEDEAPDLRELGLTLRPAQTPAEHEQLDRLRPLQLAVQALREGSGGIRWYVTADDGTVVFTAWTYRSRVLVSEQPTTTIGLPSRTIQVEDTYVPATQRGTSVFKPCFLAMLHAVAEYDGLDRVTAVTKIDEENTRARKAAGHVGFSEFAVVDGTRILSRFTRWRVNARDATVLPELETLGR